MILALKFNTKSIPQNVDFDELSIKLDAKNLENQIWIPQNYTKCWKRQFNKIWERYKMIEWKKSILNT